MKVTSRNQATETARSATPIVNQLEEHSGDQNDGGVCIRILGVELIDERRSGKPHRQHVNPHWERRHRPGGRGDRRAKEEQRYHPKSVRGVHVGKLRVPIEGGEFVRSSSSCKAQRLHPSDDHLATCRQCMHWGVVAELIDATLESLRFLGFFL
jgi:hypothetical protein